MIFWLFLLSEIALVPNIRKSIGPFFISKLSFPSDSFQYDKLFFHLLQSVDVGKAFTDTTSINW